MRGAVWFGGPARFAVLPVFVFVQGTLVAAFAPRYAPYLWLLGFGGLFIHRLVREEAAQDDT